MSMLMRLALAPAAVALVLLAAAQASATVLTFDTSQSQFDPGIRNNGWWSATFSNDDANNNYFVGRAMGHVVRNFFSFDLSGLDLSGLKVTSASLHLTKALTLSDGTSETVEFFDVSTDAATLNNNAGVSASIFDDLGTGTSYGSFDVDLAGSIAEVLVFDLNAAAIADVAGAAGGFFSVGGSLSSLSATASNEGLFAETFDIGTQRLVLNVEPASVGVPEPPGIALLAAGLLGLGLRLRRRGAA